MKILSQNFDMWKRFETNSILPRFSYFTKNSILTKISIFGQNSHIVPEKSPQNYMWIILNSSCIRKLSQLDIV